MAYTELVFVEEHWPDFDKSIFLRAIAEYARRQRRFGGVPAAAAAG
jgi:undecaprenyl diphosphate synthase